MLKMTMGNEVKLIIVAIVCALLLILGHVLLAKAFADMAWAEYTTAAIPFVMMAICGLAIKYAIDQDVDQPLNNDSQLVVSRSIRRFVLFRI